MVKIINKTKKGVIFETSIARVSGNYLGIHIPKAIEDDFKQKQRVIVCLKKK